MRKTYYSRFPSDLKAKWLTIGDGVYGNDARYIIEKGCYALPTDISDILLKEAVSRGYISEYKKENAESLSFDDSEFDFIFCKESYHHFPRPTIALYEMLRVAKKAVILIEPNDHYITSNIAHHLFRNIKNSVKFFLRKNINYHAFETSGNYMYSISRREIEKLSLGLNCATVAFKGINDFYLKGVESEKYSDHGPLKRKTKKTIWMLDLLCKIGITDFRLITAIVLKITPSKNLVSRLKQHGYKIIDLPSNPYIC